MYKTTLLQIIHAAYILLAITTTFGCNHDEAIDERLNRAEKFMETRPDSSLCILDAIVDTDIKGNRRKARYALLKSMALDKNYIDTTTFDVLQPAIDYYSKHGSADERLRTYYYQAVIYKNVGEDDLAMQTNLRALDAKGIISDSLTLARLFVAQAALYYKQYKISDFINNNLIAAKIYEHTGNVSKQLQCYCRAVNGEIIMKNELKADSLLDICRFLIERNPSLTGKIVKQEFRYAVDFGSKDYIREKLYEVLNSDVSEDMKLVFARAYSIIGESRTSLRYLNEVYIAPDDIIDSLTYWSVKTEVFENMGEDRKALDAYRNYSRVLEVYHMIDFSRMSCCSRRRSMR